MPSWLRKKARTLPEWIKYILKGKFGSAYRKLRLNLTKDVIWIKKIDSIYYMLYTRNSHNGFFYVHGYYHKELYNYIKQLDYETIFIDVGANVGVFSLAARKCRHVIAFEPEKQNYDMLNETLKLNNLTNITTEFKAISDESFNKMFIGIGHGLHSIKKRKSTTVSLEVFLGSTQDIITIGLDNYLKENNIGIKNNNFVIKIDTEGHEDQVLASMTELLESKNVTTIFEFTKTALTEDEIDKIRELLKHHTLYVFELGVTLSMDQILTIDSPIVLNIKAERI